MNPLVSTPPQSMAQDTPDSGTKNPQRTTSVIAYGPRPAIAIPDSPSLVDIMPVQGQNGPWNFLFPHASLTNPDSPQAEVKAHEPRREYRQVKVAVACALYTKAGAPHIHFTLIMIGDNGPVVAQISIMSSPESDARASLQNASVAGGTRRPMSSLARKLFGPMSVLLSAMLLSGHASGQMAPPPDWSAVETLIRTDGSLGPGGTLTAETEFPGVFVIGEELGTSFGQNLFHSFESFNLGAGDTAKFTASRPFSSVVSRITGSAPSYLNGQIRSDISGADFYFLNPSGVFFGPGASLDVPGAFYASTADDLEFSDGRVFAARPGSDPPLLSMANPAAFGFFGQAPIGRIGVDESNLRMAPGQALTLVGGDIEISGGFLQQGVLRAPGGTVSLLAVASAGKARFDASDPSGGIDSLSFASLGAIELNELAFIDTRNYGSDSNGALEILDFGPSGDVFLTADSVRLLEFSLINTRSYGIGGSGNVNIEAGDYIQDWSDIWTDAQQLGSFRDFGEGNAGNVRILASRSARLVDSGISASIFVLDPDDPPTSSAGTIEIRVGEGPATGSGDAPPAQPDLRLSNTQIQIVNAGSGSGGALELSAEELVIESGSLLGSLSTGTGAAGSVSLLGRRSIALHDSGINAGSLGAGAGGEIRLEAPDIALAGNGLLAASTSGSGSGDRVLLLGERIRLTGGFGITTINSSLGPGAGAGADIEIQASESLLLEDVGLFSATFGDGDAGNITISGNGITNPDVSILGGEIGALAVAESGPTVGNAGNISVRARTLSMDASPNRLTLVNAGTAFAENLGQGGDIVLEIDERIDISSGAHISSGVWGQGEGGAVRVTSPNATMTVEGSIDTSTFGSAPAGIIEIDVKSLEIRDGGFLAAIANSEGAGGDIDIRASKSVEISGRSSLNQPSRITTEASGVGAAGSIFVQTPRLTL
ncbi:MAG TPA: filamentous hemagglutinin N-terminal domain-containing protein, partial [Myxococcales bacterium]|nr:filamentous hemagglutinin N-terminal domain-containing protein [Myxococcales bacterium]